MKPVRLTRALGIVISSVTLVGGAAIQTDQVPHSAVPDPAIEAALLAAHPDYDANSVEIFGRESRYVYSLVDLDDDGLDEALAYLVGPHFCGTGGCPLVLMRRTGDAYEVLQSFSISSVPVQVLESRTAGWRDLLRPESGGGASASAVRHAFDGRRYVEAERLAGGVELPGVAVLTGEVTYTTAAPLLPRE